MKAAILEKFGESPKYKDFPDPEIQNDEQLLLHVKAASVKNLDKLRASGNHYASHTELPAVVGTDGVGILEDGTRVYAQGITGMMAEKAIVHKNKYTLIPENLDFNIAAALANAVLGATISLKGNRGNKTWTKCFNQWRNRGYRTISGANCQILRSQYDYCNR